MRCRLCCKEFKYRMLLRRHINCDHRSHKAPKPVQYDKPQVVPESICSVQILRLYEDTQPTGRKFAKADFPLVKLRYDLPDNKRLTAITSYKDVRQRFAKEMCEYYMSRTTFIGPPEGK